MKNNLLFRGTATALVTPFQKHDPEKIDETAFLRLLQMQGEAGVPALVIGGTTGEASALTSGEHTRLIELAKENSDASTVIIAGCGASTTAKTVSLTKNAASAGADAALIVTPYYNKCSQEGLWRHYMTIADQSDIPLIVYEVPSRTGMKVSVETYKRLAAHPQIIGVKDATSDMERTALLLNAVGDSLALYTGCDGVIVPTLAMNGHGVISVLSNLMPKTVCRLCELCFEKSYAQAAALQCTLAPLIRALFEEVNPIPVKAALAARGLCAPVYRLPLCPFSDEESTHLLSLWDAVLQKTSFIEEKQKKDGDVR